MPLAATIREAVRHYVLYDDDGSEDARAFAAYSRDQFRKVITGVVALLGGSIALTWPLDTLIFPARPDVRQTYTDWRVDSLLTVLSFLAVMASPIGKRAPFLIFLAWGAFAMTWSAMLFANFGGVSSPFLYVSFAFFFMVVPFPLPIVERALATAWLEAAFISGAIYGNPRLPSDPFFAYFILCGSLAVFASIVFGHIVFHLARNNFFQKRAIAVAHDKNERLLLNILPASIAARLKEEPGAIADRLAEVTVLFADITGFTPLSESMQPEQLVELLNRIFSAFDAIVDELGLEKIKTIGDAYMVAGGLPVPSADHAHQVAELALRMRDAAGTFRAPDGRAVEMRIGMHTGPVVAGVIGARKFSYDLWGDTVNTASRMESHGEPGKITVTSAARERLGARYRFTARGSVKVKGKGEMELFFLDGRTDESAEKEPANPDAAA